jgi:hypothetical protein
MIHKVVIVVLVLVVAAASAAFLICTPQSSQTPVPAAVVTQSARTAPVPRPPRTGTVLRIECDIPDEVGPVPMSYPGRIDWPGHSERFPFTLSKDTLAVALDSVVPFDKTVRVFFIVDENPPFPTKFRTEEWYYRGRLRRDAGAPSANTATLQLSWFKGANRFSQTIPPRRHLASIPKHTLEIERR